MKKRKLEYGNHFSINKKRKLLDEHKCSFKCCIRENIENSLFCSKHDDVSTIEIRKTIFFSKKSYLILPNDLIINIILETLPISKLELNSFYNDKKYINKKLNDASKFKILRFIYFISSINKEISNSVKMIIEDCYLFLYLNDRISTIRIYTNYEETNIMEIYNSLNNKTKKEFLINNIEKITEFYIKYKKHFKIQLTMSDLNKDIIKNGLDILETQVIEKLKEDDEDSEITISTSDDV